MPAGRALSGLRVAVVGGTGRTGRRIAEAALAAGAIVSVFGRSASPETVPAGAAPVRGDATDALALGALAEAVDAVVLSLSIPRASASPFARVTGPPDLHSRSARALLAVLRPDQRLVKLSAQGVGDSAPRTGLGFRAIVAVSNVGAAFADHAVADGLVAASAVRWTVLRPPRLSDGEEAEVEGGEDLSTGSFETVPRAAVARFAAAALVDPGLERRVLTVRRRRA